MRLGFGRCAVLALGAMTLTLSGGRQAWAQTPQPAMPSPARPGTPALPAPAAGNPAEPPSPPPSTEPTPPPHDLVDVSPGGITSEQVGARAATTSYTARSGQETLRGAAARVDEAWAAFLPRLTGVARYTRYSDFTPPAIFGGGSGGSLVGTTDTKAPVNPNTLAPIPVSQFTFPLVLDNYLLQATITVPISDYFLRLTQNYSAATHSEAAARYDLLAARATSAADGRVTFYSWLRARGAVVVAIEALNDQRNHLKLAQDQFNVGQASRADVLRAETNVASAELQVTRSQNLADLTEKQVRIATHARDEERLSPGEKLDGPLAPLQGNLPQLTDEALSARLEIKSIDANAAAAREQAKAAKAQAWPTVSAFGDGIYANPNPRVFPATAKWFPTWDVGAQAIWSPNDLLLARANVSDLDARAAALDAQKGTLRDSIQLEVVQAWQAVREADASLESAKRELASAGEAYRVAKELFNNGRATSTTLTDSETELTRSRLDVLNASADARTARVRLDHALGRDLSVAGAP